MSREFFMLYGDEDGGHIVGPLSKEELLRNITPNDDGCNWYGRDKFLNEKAEFDYWEEDALLIIEGKIVQPSVKRLVVKEYDI